MNIVWKQLIDRLFTIHSLEMVVRRQNSWYRWTARNFQLDWMSNPTLIKLSLMKLSWLQVTCVCCWHSPALVVRQSTYILPGIHKREWIAVCCELTEIRQCRMRDALYNEILSALLLVMFPDMSSVTATSQVTTDSQRKAADESSTVARHIATGWIIKQFL